MSNTIRKNDIIQQEEIEKALQSITEFVKTLKTAIDDLKSSTGLETFKGIDKEAKKLTETKKKLAEADKAVNSELLKMKEALGKQRSKEYMEELRAMAQSAREVAAAEKKKNAEMQKSKEVLDKQRTKAYTDELKRQEQGTRLLIRAQQADKGSKQQLLAQNRLLEHQMKGLNTLIPEQRREYERLNREVNNNKKRITELNPQATGLRKVFAGLTKTVGSYFLALIGVQRVISFFTKDLLNLTMKLDAMDYSMRTIMKTEEEFAQAQLFLSETAYNYGQDILTLTERYIKFRAAAQQSNMSITDTQKIFDSTAKAAAVLGLKTDEVNGVFLALEQMISKGKVTTEELRRQLGERLPGAFGIMADAVGVSISELDKMMKAGSVLSTEALPKFAVALEKAYGIEAVNTVDTLAAAQGRLKTSWVEFVDSLEASKGYLTVMAMLNQGFLKWAVTMSGGSRDLQLFSQMTNDAGRTVNLFTKALDLIPLNELDEDSKKFWTNWLDMAGFTTSQALRIWEQYYEKRRLYEMEDGVGISIIDADVYKKELNAAQKEFENFANIKDESFRKLFLKETAFVLEETNTYKKYLWEQVTEKGKMLEEADAQYKKQQALAGVAEYELEKTLKNGSDEQIKIARNKYQKQNDLAEKSLNNHKALVQMRMMLENELNDLSGGGGNSGKDNTLNIKKAQHKSELEQFKREQQELLLFQSERLAKQFQNEKDYNAALLSQKEANKQSLINLQIDQQNELLKFVEQGSLEEAKILADRDKLYTDLAEAKTDFQIKEMERGKERIDEILKDEQEQREAHAEELLSIANEEVHQRYLALLEESNKEIKASKGNTNEIRRIENELTNALIDEEIARLNTALNSMDERTDAYAKTQERLKQLDEMKGEAENRRVADEEKYKYDLKKEYEQRIQDLVLEGFNLADSLYNAQLERLKRHYDLEVAIAGDSVEKRLIAERKYEKEKAKIMRKQAIMQKAQSAFGIALNTAQAIMAVWAEFPLAAPVLTPIIAATGAMQLAAVLAEPIPEYAKGTDFAPETFIAGEKGSELIFKDDGTAILTPDSPTLFSDKSFIGSTILPHDQTQKWLANYAVSQTYDIIDMSDTNKYLKNIANNTKSRKEIFERNGKMYMRRGNITSQI